MELTTQQNLQQTKLQQACLQKSEVVLELVKICFKTLKTYKTTAEDLPAINKQFLLALSGYDTDEIKNAFRVYLDENREFPTTSCIKRIILGNQKHKRKMKEYDNQAKRNPTYDELPDELKLKVDDSLLEVKANLVSRAAPKELSELNYSHWNREPQRDGIMQELIELTKEKEENNDG